MEEKIIEQQPKPKLKMEWWRKLTPAKKVFVIVLSYALVKGCFWAYYFVDSYIYEYKNARFMREYRARKQSVDATSAARAHQEELERIKAERGISGAPFDIAPVMLPAADGAQTQFFGNPSGSAQNAARQPAANAGQNVDSSAEVAAYEAARKAQEEAAEKAKAEAAQKAEGQKVKSSSSKPSAKGAAQSGKAAPKAKAQPKKTERKELKTHSVDWSMN
jgi:hypothetical protein